MNALTTKSEMNFKGSMNKLYEFIKTTDDYKTHLKKNNTILFLSIGFIEKRATIISTTKGNFENAWKDLYDKARHYIFNKNTPISFLKVDLVDSQRKHTIVDFIKKMTMTKKNYIREGICFDSNFKNAFLEQEVNGNAMIQIDKNTNRGYLNEKNIAHYIKGHRPYSSNIDFNKINEVITFKTKGFFLDDGVCYQLINDPYDNGRRNTTLNSLEVEKMITTSSNYLNNINQESGKFVYGYFSCFDREINFYNMLRHSSTLYSMVESYELFPNKQTAITIKKGIDFLIENSIYFDDNNNLAHVIDGVNPDNLEIKLGANAAAILAITKYTEVFNDRVYLSIAQKLARGILDLQQADGNFYHVLHYPSLKLKDKFRIIYYDGEAAFALMRLFQLDQEELWLESVEKAFDFFIKNDYWKNHDHWLSYCTNELIQFKPLRKYFEFGLLNVKDRLTYIYKRETTYPTFLELTVAAYKMVQTLKETEHHDLLQEFDEEILISTIHRRAEYQRNGYFYPELAIYFKNPQRIIGSFFIRHHSFRSRIDDVEHYLSGYCQYYKQFLSKDSSV